MQTLFIADKIDYNGSQLRSHFAFDTCQLTGNSVVAFIGGCDVKPEHMIDLADKNAGCKIASRKMLHFIIEDFGITLNEAILHQRLFVATMADLIRDLCKGAIIKRSGNDLYDGDKKINISIATASPISCLVHVGINIDSKGTPVPTKGLADYSVDPKGFALELMKRYKDEVESIRIARAKVRAAK